MPHSQTIKYNCISITSKIPDSSDSNIHLQLVLFTQIIRIMIIIIIIIIIIIMIIIIITIMIGVVSRDWCQMLLGIIAESVQ